MQSSLVYNGHVNITINKKTNYYRNSGDTELFKLFSQWLAGQNILSDVLPSYMYLRDPSKDKNISYKLIVTKDTATYQGNPATVVTSKIDDIDLLAAASEAKNPQLCLYNNYNQILAHIDISSNIIAQITQGRQALVDWFLFITNNSAKES